MWPFKRKVPTDKKPERAYASPYRPVTPDEGFDSAGFAIGVATGIPISPTRGISPEAIIGSTLHQSSHPTPADHSSSYTPSHHHHHTDTSTPTPTPSYDSGSSSTPSFDSGSSSSSFDSGSLGGTW